MLLLEIFHLSSSTLVLCFCRLPIILNKRSIDHGGASSLWERLHIKRTKIYTYYFEHQSKLYYKNLKGFQSLIHHQFEF